MIKYIDIHNALNQVFKSEYKPLQIRYEIYQLLKELKELKPERILEIGTFNGGTLWLFSKIFPDAQIVSIDLPGGEFGGGYPEERIPYFELFGHVQLIRDDSHKVDVLNRAKTLFRNKPIDFLFIDGDHTYEGVKRDYEDYSPLVREGGYIAFHDIVKHTKESKCEVERFWQEIKGKHQFKEIVLNPGQGRAGIGVLVK